MSRSNKNWPIKTIKMQMPNKPEFSIFSAIMIYAKRARHLSNKQLTTNIRKDLITEIVWV